VFQKENRYRANFEHNGKILPKDIWMPFTENRLKIRFKPASREEEEELCDIFYTPFSSKSLSYFSNAAKTNQVSVYIRRNASVMGWWPIPSEFQPSPTEEDMVRIILLMFSPHYFLLSRSFTSLNRNSILNGSHAKMSQKVGIYLIRFLLFQKSLLGLGHRRIGPLNVFSVIVPN
jgi:hypothetical protein